MRFGIIVRNMAEIYAKYQIITKKQRQSLTLKVILCKVLLLFLIGVFVWLFKNLVVDSVINSTDEKVLEYADACSTCFDEDSSKTDVNSVIKSINEQVLDTFEYDDACTTCCDEDSSKIGAVLEVSNLDEMIAEDTWEFLSVS